MLMYVFLLSAFLLVFRTYVKTTVSCRCAWVLREWQPPYCFVKWQKNVVVHPVILDLQTSLSVFLKKNNEDFIVWLQVNIFSVFRYISSLYCFCHSNYVVLFWTVIYTGQQYGIALNSIISSFLLFSWRKHRFLF